MTRHIARGFFATAALFAVLGLGATNSMAQDTWPSKPIKLVVPWPPGGVADYLGRLVANQLPVSLGQPIIVENKPGASTNIGSEMVAKSAPDGYTLLVASSNNAVNMSLFRNMSYDSDRDFAPVALLGFTPMVLVKHPSVPGDDLKQFIQFVTANPGKITYASAGNGSPAHLAAALFVREARVRMTHVPYKGAAPAVSDLIGGHVDVLFTNIPASIGPIRSSKLKALAVTGKGRSPALPTLPTFAEAGLPNYDANAWYGVVAPKNTPAAIVDRLADAIAKGLSAQDVRQRIANQGVELAIEPPKAFGERIRSDINAYRKLIQEIGLQPG